MPVHSTPFEISILAFRIFKKPVVRKGKSVVTLSELHKRRIPLETSSKTCSQKGRGCSQIMTVHSTPFEITILAFRIFKKPVVRRGEVVVR